MAYITWQEKEIEDYLMQKSSQNRYTKLYDYYKLIAIKRQFKILDFRIDILAYSKIEKCFYIIELKKDELDTEAYCQAMKYLNLMRTKYTNCKFKILLIGNNLNEQLYYNVKFYDNLHIENLHELKKNKIYDDLKEELEEINDDIFNYSLYQMSLEDGLGFNYYNKEQKDIQNQITDLKYETIDNRKLTIYRYMEKLENGSF